MKLAIVNITGGGMSGGYRQYLTNMLPRLASYADIEDLLCVSPAALNVKDWVRVNGKVKFSSMDENSFLSNRFAPKLRRYLEEFSPDLIFLPAGRILKFKKVPVVNMIKNMEPFAKNIDRYTFSERLQCRLRSLEIKIAAKAANRVIAISGFVQDFLINRWRISRGKISLIKYGSAHLDDIPGKRPENISRDWAGKFIFTAGSIRPARGLEDLIFAAKDLRFNDVSLKGIVIAGQTIPNMSGYERKLRDLTGRLGLESRIVFAGSLNNGEMKWCYQNCAVFVMTSRVESFGMIAVEAMSEGCSCISADNPCLPETFGDAAFYYPPKDAKTLSGLIKKVLVCNNQERTVISEKARQRASEFSWDVCAQETMSAFRKTIEDSKETNQWIR